MFYTHNNSYVRQSRANSVQVQDDKFYIALRLVNAHNIMQGQQKLDKRIETGSILS